MAAITREHVEAVYDAVSLMRLFSQWLSQGDVDDTEASEMSWLLGSAKKRLEPVIEVLEELEDKRIKATFSKSQGDAG